MSRLSSHLHRMDKETGITEKPYLIHSVNKYRSRTSPQELGDQIVKNLVDTLRELHQHDKKRLLSLTNLELTDAQFRRALRIALQS